MIEGLKFRLTGKEVRALFAVKVEAAQKNLAETNQLIDNVLTAREQKAKTTPVVEKTEVQKAVDEALARNGILKSGGLNTEQEDSIIEQVKGEVGKQLGVLTFYFEHIHEDEIYLLTADEIEYLKDQYSGFDGSNLVRRIRRAKNTLSGVVRKMGSSPYDGSEEVEANVFYEGGEKLAVASAPYAPLDRL